MIEITHTYSLSSDWLKAHAEQFKVELINEKLLVVPKELADGGFFFTTITPGLSVVLLDITFNQEIHLRRLKSDNNLFIIHYDFSDEMNLIYVEGIEHKIGYKANLGLGVFDNALENVFIPVIGDRVFAMRLMVSKELLSTSIAKSDTENPAKRKIKSDKNTLFFYDHIDSKSKVIMHAIKNKSFLDPAFEIYLKGVINQVAPEIEVVAICDDLPSGVLAIRKFQPEIVFLDIEMPKYNGLEIVNFFGKDEFSIFPNILTTKLFLLFQLVL